MSYLGRGSNLTRKAQDKVSFLATAGQTVRTGLSYVPTHVDVTVNGITLTEITDYTATNGNSITFTVALALNDEVTIVSSKTFDVANHYTISAANALLAAKATNTAVALKSPIASPVFTGNVGIGVTPESWYSAYSVLQVGGLGAIAGETSASAGGATRFSNNVYLNSGGSWAYQVTDEASLYQQVDGVHTFRVAASGSANSAISWNDAMIIANNGTVDIKNSAGFGMRVYSPAGANGGRTDQNRDTDGAITAYYKDNGYKGGVNITSSAVAYVSISDYRLKTDVQSMTGATDRVKLLKPCNFEWIVDGTRVDGFLAHEAQEVVPESVTGTKDAMRDEEYEVTAATDTEAAVMGTRSVPDLQGIDQSKLVPLLTATIQELITRIEALENV